MSNMDIESEFNEYLSALEDEYRRNITAGMKQTTAKKAAKAACAEAYPAVVKLLALALRGEPGDPQRVEAHRMAQRMRELWGQLQTEVRPRQANSTPAPAASPSSSDTNGGRKRIKPGIVLAPSGYSNVMETVLRMIAASELKPGDVLVLGNLHVLHYLIGCTRSVIPNLLFNKGRYTAVGEAGYEFEAIPERGEYTDYAVRCIAVPRTARDAEIDELRQQMAAQMAAHQQEMKAIEERLRALGV